MKNISEKKMLDRRVVLPMGKRLFVWINILLQLLFPVAVSLTPAIAASEKSAISQMATQPYELKKGETTVSVAGRYQLTLDELARLNQFRTFSKPFNTLGEGAEIDVPASPVKSLPTPASLAQGSQDKQLAQAASQFGQLMSSEDKAQSATGMATGMVNSKVNQTVSDLLSQFGTAKVQLNTNNKFAFADSQLDVLFPLYDHGSDVFFTQSGIRDTDGRTIANLGIGDRWFTDSTMMGANLFIDRDIGRRHTRIGTGGEYWRDYLKLAANGYFAVSGWKQSRDLEDYDERPANGFDLRSDMYLPNYPQLGAKLTYEQYYGRNVGLFGKDNLQHNPAAVTAGLTYTPVPLLTFDLGQKQGEQHKHDTQLSVNLTYNFAQGFAEQLNPSMVALKRSLAGSRYDLVDRNNDIVLQYRKQELVHLKVADSVSGMSGETKPLNVSASAKHGIDKIDYQASAGFDAAGGVVTNQHGNYTVKLPVWNVRSNHYTLTFVATDKKGNTSKPQVSNITVEASPVNGDNSSLTSTLADDSMVADGVGQTDIVIKLADSNGSPAIVDPESIKPQLNFDFSAPDGARRMTRQHGAAVKAEPYPTLGPVTANAGEPGSYVSVLTAGYASGVATINVEVEGVQLKNTLTVKLTPIPIDTGTGSADFEVNKNTIKADGNELATLTFSIKDNNGKLVKNLARAPAQLTFSLSTRDGVKLSAIEENPEGIYKAVLGGTKAQTVDVTPVVRGEALNDNKLGITLLADGSSLTLDDGSTSVTRDGALANGADKNEITASVKDRFGNPVSGASLIFSASNGAQVVASPSDTNGTVIATVTSTIAGSSRVTISLPNEQSITRDVNFIADTGTAHLASGSFTVVADNAPADGASLNTVKVKVEDASGNPIKGADVTFASTPSSGITLAATPVTTGDDGFADADLFSAAFAGKVTVTATLSGSSAASDKIDVNFVGNPKTADTNDSDINITLNGSAANGTDQNQVQVTVKDANRNLLEGIPVTFSSEIDGITFAKPSADTNQSGVATVDASSTKAGNRNFTVTVNGHAHKSTMSFVGESGTSTVESFTSSDDASALTVSDSATHTLTATIMDKNDNLVSNEPVTFKVAGNPSGVTLSGPNPAYTDSNGKATTQITSTLAGTFTVIALVRNDVVSGKSQQLTFVADKTQATSILALNVVDDGAIVGSESNSVQATLTDSFGNPLENETISFTAGNGGILSTPTVNTDKNGVAVVHITNINAGDTTVTAKWGEKTSPPQNVRFVADAGSATLLASNVKVLPSSAVANDTNLINITAKVTDISSNAVPGQNVTFELSPSRAGATFDDGGTTKTVLTGPSGEAVANVKAATAGDYTVKVSVTNGRGEISSHDVVVTFNPDLATAQVTWVKALTEMLADGNENEVLAEVKDAKGNLVDGATVTFTVDSPATFVGGSNSIDAISAKGVAEVKLKSTLAGAVTVSAVTAIGELKTANVTFVADRATATISDADFKALPEQLVANGTSVSTLTATVKDAQGNPVEQQNVIFAIASGTGVTLSGTTVKSGADGTARVTLTSGALANDVVVTASTNEQSVSKTIHLIADETTAAFKDDVETSVQVLAADGLKKSTVSAYIVDAKGNPVPNMLVTFTAKPATATLTGSGGVNTDAAGKATVDMTSVTPGDVVVTASIELSSGSHVTKDSSPVHFVKPYIEKPLIDTTRNSHPFAANEGFPQTGFDTAAFTISPTGAPEDNKLFDWNSSDSASASVSAGIVTLHDKPAGEVTIKATYPTGEIYVYKFTIKKWFTHGDKVGNALISGTQTQVMNICESTYKMRLPANADYSDGPDTRSVGKVFGEWGDLTQWGWRNDSGKTTADWYYTSDSTISGVYLRNGDTSDPSAATSIYPAACMK